MSDVSSKRVRSISLEETVGRTVARVESAPIDSREPTVTLHFSDGTYYVALLYEKEEMLAEDWVIKRVDSPHVEDIVGGRARCRICGYIDEADPEDPTVREWHGDSFGDMDVAGGAEDLAERARLTKPPGAR